MPIEFVRVTCFNNAHFEEPFFSTCADRRTPKKKDVSVTFGIPITEAQSLCFSEGDAKNV